MSSMKPSAHLHETLAARVRDGRPPGLVTLVSRRGVVEVDVQGRMAIGGGEPMRRDAIFRISSMTKPVAAAAAMILVEDGKLRLDEPLDGLLPELASRRVLRRLDGPLDDTVPAARSITLRDLLTFRMGFGLIWGAQDATPIQRAVAELHLGAFGPPKPQVAPEPDEWMRRFATLPLMHQPGERWMYNTSAEVLGVVIARAAKTSFEGFLRERIFEPLGMRDTSFSVPASKLDRLPVSYMAQDAFHPDAAGSDLYDGVADGQWARPPAFPSGGAGLVSTADDYFAFARMLAEGGALGGKRILAAASVAEMTRDQLTPEEKARSTFYPPDYWQNHGWGFGMTITTGPRKPEEPGGYGWDGGLGTTWRTDPEEGLIAILLTQRAAFPAISGVYCDFWRGLYGGPA